MTASREQALGEGNCVRVTARGKEACECVRKYRPEPRRRSHSHQICEATYRNVLEGRISGRVGQTLQSRILLSDQVKGELAQRRFMSLSGETCIDGLRAVAAPAIKACLKARNGPVKADSGGAGVSRGRSTAPRIPIETGRTKR
jgi:hypothetical protein